MDPDGNVTSGTLHGSAEMRQMRICGWRPGSNVPPWVVSGAIGGSQ
jgi:hypothetical protein